MPNPSPAVAVILAATLAALLAPANRLFAHPDLLLQIEQLDREIATHPQNAELLARRGDLHRRHQDYAAASSDLNAARAADPGYALVDLLEGSLFLDTGRPDRAEQSLSRYLATHPEHAAAWILRARAWLGLDKPASAAEDLQKAIATAGKPGPEVYRLLVLSLAAQGADRGDAALRAVNAGLARFPVEVSLLALGADIALGLDRLGEADSYFRRLPDAVRALPQWQSRMAVADCMSTTGGPQRAACAARARENLDRQVEAFLADRPRP